MTSPHCTQPATSQKDQSLGHQQVNHLLKLGSWVFLAPIRHDVESSSSIGFGSLHGGVSEPEADFGHIFDLQVLFYSLNNQTVLASTHWKFASRLSTPVGYTSMWPATLRRLPTSNWLLACWKKIQILWKARTNEKWSCSIIIFSGLWFVRFCTIIY